MASGVATARADSFWANPQDLILPGALITSLVVVLVPLPPAILDVLLAANVGVSVIMLVTTVFVRTPLEFSIFPTLLLATTLGRLVLNVATTRAILTRGETHKLMAAGGVVKGFGEFVAGDRIAVGLIIFAIIVIIQFVVITKGSTRISEVAARFALDGLPGRQMAIEADLNADLIDAAEAQRQRQALTQQADFFGAMDGASKFVRGDAIAGIIIILINIIGGLFIGVIQGGLPIAEAASVYTRLTIGDGLVSQVPAFLISLAAGLLVTRSNRDYSLPREFITQLFARPQALFVAATFMGVLVFTELPRMPLLAIGGLCAFVGMAQLRRAKGTKVAEEKAMTEAAQKPVEEKIEKLLAVDPMEIELGVGLIRLADPKRGGDLKDRVHRVRQIVATETGIIMPKVRIRDNIHLEQNKYRLKIAGNVVSDGMVFPSMLLAIDSGVTAGKIDGIATREPARGTPAVWIEPAQRDRAQSLGYTVVEPVAVVTTHLTECVKKHADELLTRDACKHLIQQLREESPAVVDELIPGLLKLGDVQQVLQILLREQIPIRQLPQILEALGDLAAKTKDPIYLAEAVRHRLSRTLCARYRDADNRMLVVTLDPALEDRIRSGIEHSERGMFIRMSPSSVEATCQAIAREVERLIQVRRLPVVLVSPQIRAGLRRMTESHMPHLSVLSYQDLTRDTIVESVGVVRDADVGR